MVIFPSVFFVNVYQVGYQLNSQPDLLSRLLNVGNGWVAGVAGMICLIVSRWIIPENSLATKRTSKFCRWCLFFRYVEMAIVAMLRVSLGGNVAGSCFLVFHWFIVHPEHDNVECGTKKNKLYNACYPDIGVYETSMTTHLRYTEVIWYSTEVITM